MAKELKDLTPDELSKMSQAKLRKVWGEAAKKSLVGKTIVDVYYHNEKQNKEIFGDDYASNQANIRIVFDDGHWITASRDDEGNGSGVIFTTDENLSTIPSIGFDNV